MSKPFEPYTFSENCQYALPLGEENSIVLFLILRE